MSKVDLELTEKVLLDLNEMKKNLVDVKDTTLGQENRNGDKQMDPDLQDWLEIFEEDQVVMYGCR
ncbi:MAG: hypothetical protein ABF276_07300 [Sulfurovum sp.]